MYTNDVPRWYDPFHLWLLSFCLTALGKWNEPPFAFSRQDYDIGNRFCKHHKAPLFVLTTLLVYWGTEIILVHHVWIGFNLGNQGLLAFQRDSRALISYHTYLFLIEFEGRTVRYGPSFFRSDLWHKREVRGKTRFYNLLYGPIKTSLGRNYNISWFK